MDPLEPPALHHVKAAFGWIELGNVPEALAELARVPVELQSLPTVRAARLDCLIAAKHWDAAAALAGEQASPVRAALGQPGPGSGAQAAVFASFCGELNEHFGH